jgi:UDP-N-acetylmuramate dehydrogenase
MSSSMIGPEPGRVGAALSALGPLAGVDVPLGPLTTCRVGGRAALFVEATTVADLGLVARAARASGLPVLVVGRGSNLLVADAGFPGIAVTLVGGPFSQIDIGVEGGGGGEVVGGEVGGGGEVVVVRAGGAVFMPVLARQAAAAGLTGMEWAVGIPGSVGGAVRMNAGGHGSDISGSLRACRWLDLDSGAVVERPVDGLAFGYRRSAVTSQTVVISADFVLRPGDREAAEASIREIVRWRREHQPGGQNAGSVFTNPEGPPPRNSAGWLVEAAGLKGYRHGTAAVSDKHANFIQADPGGAADDVVALMMEIQRQVEERFGIRLHAEVKLVGFDEAEVRLLTAGAPGDHHPSAIESADARCRP